MKLSLATIAVSVITVLAAPTPNPGCGQMRQPCWKSKYGVDAVVESRANINNDEPSLSGVASGQVKREANPQPWCFRIGQSCWKKRALQSIQAIADAVSSSSS